MIFSLGRKKYTAVDIGAYAIKVVTMQENKGKIKILSAEHTKLPPGIIEKGEIKDLSIISNKIENLFKKTNAASKNIITSIPSNQLITRNIELPNLDNDEFDEALKWELNDIVPYPIEETVYDYIETNRNEDSINILLVVAKDAIIDQYRKPFLNLGINPDVINIQPMALISLLNYQNKLSAPTSIVDLGHQGTRVILADEDRLHLTRTISNGGIDFTENIIENQHLEYKEAEEYKKNNGIEHELNDQVESVESDISLLGIGGNLTNIAREISEEISRSLEFYSIKNRGENINNVYLTGGSVFLKGITDIIDEEVGPSPELIDPLAGFENSSFISKDKAHLYTIALGLGASEVLHNEG